MNQLSFLTKLLDGAEVEWIELGELCINISSGKNKKKSIDGLYPVFGSTGIIGRTNNKVYEKDLILIARVGANAGRVNIAKGEYDVSDNTLIAENKDSTILKYLYYYLVNINLNQYAQGAGQPLITARQLKSIQIPIPCPDNPEKSLAIQTKIVRILDSFTELTSELTTELTTELNAKKKQYTYYRDKLLSFKEGEVEWKRMGDIAQYSKMRISHELLDEDNYVGVESLLQNRAGKTKSSRVPESGNSTQYNKSDILIGNIRPYLKKIWYSDCVGGTNGDVLVIQRTDENVSPSYLYQVLADDKFFEYNMKHAKGAKMPRGNKPMIMEYLVPIPKTDTPELSLAEQNRIVDILNKFNTLTNSIIEGLPREIELRQKQYKYYRDLLLNFQKPDKIEA